MHRMLPIGFLFRVTPDRLRAALTHLYGLTSGHPRMVEWKIMFMHVGINIPKILFLLTFYSKSYKLTYLHPPRWPGVTSMSKRTNLAFIFAPILVFLNLWSSTSVN